MTALLCPRCGATLHNSPGELTCPGCGTHFPVIDGIPRLLEQDFYWGEIEQDDARRLVSQAKANGWREAVAERFTEKDLAWVSILDPQRASWIPLLGLPREAVVLDIGSGYGALTHALATQFDQVHSIEAIPERVEFTHVRLAQEGLKNVRLVQGSALSLPYPPGSFDAIIVNGVLEWIGDWDMDGTPREAQMRFLQRVHSLLKPAGQLLVGIENRLGYVTFAGALDHSGLPFTNLLPRPLASVALRTMAKRHHRMVAPSRSYRTYTYSEPGYRRLFTEAGFAHIDGYWAEPGYNNPYRLTSLHSSAVSAALEESQVQGPNRGDVSVKGRLKRGLARMGMFKHVVPDFVFILAKQGERDDWKAQLPKALRTDPEVRLTTYSFAPKTTIRVCSGDAPGVVIKSSTPTAQSERLIAEEYGVLETLALLPAEQRAGWPFLVPTPMGQRHAARQLVTCESHALGDPAATLFYNLDADERLEFLRTQLPVFAESASIISRIESLSTHTAASWLTHVEPMVNAELGARARAIGERYVQWYAHGDFTVENIIVDPADTRPTIIDWEYVRSGVPPMYDFFTLLLSVIAAIPVTDEQATEHGGALNAQFHACFFAQNPWSALVASVAARECRHLGIARKDMWNLFIDSLLFRIGYLLERGSNIATSRITFIHLALGWKETFQL